MAAVAERLQVERGPLSRALRAVARLLPSKPSLPVLSCLHLWTTGDHLYLGATDLSTSLVWEVEVEDAPPLNLAVPGSQLAAYVATLEGNQVELTPEGKHLTVRAGASHARFQTQPGEDYPRLPEAPVAQVEIPASVLRAGLERVIHAAPAEELSRPNLAGVMVRGSDTQLTITAADGSRLSTTTLELLLPFPEPVSWRLPREAAQDLLGLLPEGEALVGIASDGRQLTLIVADLVFSARLLEGAYVDYERVWPRESAVRLTTARSALIDALRQVEVLGKTNDHRIRLVVEGGTLRLQGRDPELGESEAAVPVAMEGEGSFTVGVNGVLLREAVEACEGSSVVLGLTSPEQPILLTPVEDPGAHRQLIMVMLVPR